MFIFNKRIFTITNKQSKTLFFSTSWGFMHNKGIKTNRKKLYNNELQNTRNKKRPLCVHKGRFSI